MCAERSRQLSIARSRSTGEGSADTGEESPRSFERLEFLSSFSGSGRRVRREIFEEHHRTPREPPPTGSSQTSALLGSHGLHAFNSPTSTSSSYGTTSGLSVAEPMVRDIPWLDQDRDDDVLQDDTSSSTDSKTGSSTSPLARVHIFQKKFASLTEAAESLPGRVSKLPLNLPSQTPLVQDTALSERGPRSKSASQEAPEAVSQPGSLARRGNATIEKAYDDKLHLGWAVVQFAGGSSEPGFFKVHRRISPSRRQREADGDPGAFPETPTLQSSQRGNSNVAFPGLSVAEPMVRDIPWLDQDRDDDVLQDDTSSSTDSKTGSSTSPLARVHIFQKKFASLTEAAESLPGRQVPPTSLHMRSS